MARLPESGRAAVVTDWGAQLELRDYPLVAPAPGALLVAVDCATICGSDVHAWQGALASSFDIELPIILGHETVGRIVAIGDGADRDSVGAPVGAGDRVVWAHEACGCCYECTVLRLGTMCPNRHIGFLVSAERAPHFHAGFAEYAYVTPGAGRLRVPDDVESGWAAAASCALRTIVDAMQRVGRIDSSHTVVIQGAGPLGLFATAMAATQSPRRLVVIGGPPARLDVAREWGADVVVDVAEATSPEERLAAVLDASDGRGADVVCELSGARTAIGEGLELAAVNGRYVVAGTVGANEQLVKGHLIARKNLTVIGSLGAEIDAYYKAMEFLRAHRDRFDWDRMIGGRYRLEDATTALEQMHGFADIKAAIVPALA